MKLPFRIPILFGINEPQDGHLFEREEMETVPFDILTRKQLRESL